MQTLADGLQIVPGYRLECRLGKGGFGEVWRAIGPGRVPAALKIIDLLGSKAGDREYRSLNLLRELRHPNLLPLQGYWLLDDAGQVIEDDRPPSSLVIAMLLGGKNLRQRLEECQRTGLAGIPPRELLDYLRDAAKGIDFLNRPIHRLGDRVVAIQHRDIKPENLLIVGGGLMVADFGIAGVMETTKVHTEHAAMTFAYAAPELFEHTATTWTDQYALAITYGELRTGSLPFKQQSTPMQIIMVHMKGGHDFSTLSPGESEVLKRATSAVPEQRFANCQELLNHLEEALKAANLLDTALLPDGASKSLKTVFIDGLPTALESNDPTKRSSAPSMLQPTQPRSSGAAPSEIAATAPVSDFSPAVQAGSVTPAPTAKPPGRLGRQLGIAAVIAVLAAGASYGFIAWRRGEWVRGGRNDFAIPPLLASSPPSVPDPQPETPSTIDTVPNNVSDPAPVQPVQPAPPPPDPIAAAREQAAVAARDSQFADVAKALEPVFQKNAATADDYAVRGRAYLALADKENDPADNYARAAADFTQAGLATEQLKAFGRLGRWLVDHDQPRQAIPALRSALQLAKIPTLQFLLSQAHLGAGDFVAAVDTAEESLQSLKASSHSASEWAARLHHVAAKAGQTIAEKMAADPAAAERLEELELRVEQHLEQAIAVGMPLKLDELAAWQADLAALRKSPRFVARAERQQAQNRIAELKEQIKASPQAADLWLELAGHTKRFGSEKQAATFFARGYCLRAIELAADETKLIAAAKALEKAVENDPESPHLPHARAVVAVANGRHLLRQPRTSVVLERAQSHFAAAIESEPRWAEAHYALGDCQLLSGQIAAARASFDKAVSLGENELVERQHQYRVGQATAYLRPPSNDERALAAAEQAVALQRNDPSGHFVHGLALRNFKRLTEARKAFDQALALQPKHVGSLLARSQMVLESESSTAQQLAQAQQDIETGLSLAATDDLRAEAYYVRSLASLKSHVSNMPQRAVAEPALLRVQRDLYQAVKLAPTNAVYSNAAKEAFDYAATYAWSDPQRKAESETLRRDLKAAAKP